jgi:cytidyltransferase-like protein
MKKIVTCGGTFNNLHAGHKEYLDLACEFGDKLIICVSSDSHAKTIKDYAPKPYEKRIEHIQNYLSEQTEILSVQFMPIISQSVLTNDYVSGLLDKTRLTVITPEYLDWMQDINQRRKDIRLPELLILIKPRTIDKEIGNDISSTRIISESATQSLEEKSIREVSTGQGP